MEPVDLPQWTQAHRVDSAVPEWEASGAPEGHNAELASDLGRQVACPRCDEAADTYRACYAVLSELVYMLGSDCDGQLNMSTGEDGKALYCKWKWRWGPWKGYYVMYVGWAWDIAGAVLGLAEKIHEVRNGERTPTLDTYWGQKPPR